MQLALSSLPFIWVLVACARVETTGLVPEACTTPLLDSHDARPASLRATLPAPNKVSLSVEEKLQQIFRHKLLLPEVALQQGLSTATNTSRLDSALERLVSGLPLTVVALGGSVSAAHGVQSPEHGWVARVFAWIREAFPNPDHRLLNHAIPAVTSGYVSACVPELVPEDTDLVILEFTYNDWVFSGGSRELNEPSRRGLERLVRRLSAHDSRPGLLYAHYWPAARLPFDAAAEADLAGAVLRHYDVPALSFGGAAQQLLDAVPALADQLWRPTPDPKIHPTCVGARMLADLVIGYLQLRAASRVGHTSQLTPPDAPPPPEARPFLLRGNWGHTYTACVLEDGLQQRAGSVRDWTWADEGKTEKQHKRGYVSTEPGSRLDIRAPLDEVPAPADAEERFLVGIGSLISYEHMGWLSLTCSGACACPESHHNMFHAAKFSMTGWRYANVTRLGSGACWVTATNLRDTSTGEHKLRVSTVMASSLVEQDGLLPRSRASGELERTRGSIQRRRQRIARAAQGRQLLD